MSFRRQQGPKKPVRDSDTHVHTQYWSEQDHDRFEDRVSKEIHGLREDFDGLRTDVSKLANRVTVLFTILSVVVFGVNIGVSVWIIAFHH